jgi:gliding motility-associated-like protein
MNRVFYAFLIILISVVKAEATHIFGGELYYRQLSGMTYEVNVALYGDCAGASFPQLYNQSVAVDLMKGGSVVVKLSLTLDTNTRDEITPVCPKYRDSTQCQSISLPIYGVKRFIYRDTVNLPGAANDYRFVFDGAQNGAGRTNSITNLLNTSSSPSLIYLVAELDNSEQSNNSPRFTAAPTPFYCLNIEQEYNQGAVDADGDSLVFELANALNANGTLAIYRGGYSGTYPLETSGMFSFNSLNGQMVFTPTITQSSVVVNRVLEYRNGKLVGSSMREMTFIVLGNCSNMPVKGGIDSSLTQGGLWSKGNILNVCSGTQNLSFKYNLADPDGDTVDITFDGVPGTANLTINNNGTVSPSFDFQWNLTGVPNGNYTFFVTARDRHCPVSTVQTRGFTIRVVDNYGVQHTVTQPTNCYHKATLRFDATGGISPRTYTFLQNSAVLRTVTDSAAFIVDSFDAGNYALRVSSPELICNYEYPFVVADSGIFPFMPLFNNTIPCLGEDPVPLTAISYTGATLRWYNAEGNQLPGPPAPNTSIAVPQRWYVSQYYKVCESARRQIDVTVAPKPAIRLLYDTGVVCVGERILLKAAGAKKFVWLPENQIFYEPDGSPFIRVFEAERYTVIGIDETGCSDTLTFGFQVPEACCTFSYPGAFSPNGDGRNDKWRPILYGNHRTYELSIYNRWGMRLFHSFTPNEGWDGFYEGQAQETGTYFYLMQAKCITGKAEQKQGEFVLLR